MFCHSILARIVGGNYEESIFSDSSENHKQWIYKLQDEIRELSRLRTECCQMSEMARTLSETPMAVQQLDTLRERLEGLRGHEAGLTSSQKKLLMLALRGLKKLRGMVDTFNSANRTNEELEAYRFAMNHKLVVSLDQVYEYRPVVISFAKELPVEQREAFFKRCRAVVDGEEFLTPREDIKLYEISWGMIPTCETWIGEVLNENRHKKIYHIEHRRALSNYLENFTKWAQTAPGFEGVPCPVWIDHFGYLTHLPDPAHDWIQLFFKWKTFVRLKHSL